MVIHTTITAKVQTIRKSVNGYVYVYERTPYYYPVTKNTKYHYKYTGKEDKGVKHFRRIF